MKSKVRKFREYPPIRKVAVKKGYGPRSAENALEGEIPDPLQERVLKLAGGGKDVPEEADSLKLAGTAAESALTRQLFDKLGELYPEEQLHPDFIKLRRELGIDPLMAQKGKSDVGGWGGVSFFDPAGRSRMEGNNPLGYFTNRPMNPYTGTPGTRENPISLAIGPNSPHKAGDLIQGPYGWGRVEDFGGGVGKKGRAAVDVAVGGGFKKWAYGQGGPGGGGGKWLKRHGGLDMNPAGKGNKMYRDLSEPRSWGLGTQFWETPESQFPRATPGPFSQGGQGQPVVGKGQVMVGNTYTSDGIEYAPTTDPKNPGYVALNGPNEGQVIRSLPGGATPTPAEPGGGVPPVGEGGGIRGGPFQGWSPQNFSEWHSGAGPSQMGYPSFTGNTAGPGGQQLSYETTSSNVPGYGWVPHAQLANSMASNNFWDYMNPFGGTTRGGEGTGVPTQKAIGTAVGTATNLFIPGAGYLTGPASRWLTSKIQNMIAGGASKGDIGRAVAKAQAQAKAPPMPSGSVDLPDRTSTSGGGGYYSPNYLRSIGYTPGQGTGSLWPGGAPFSGGANIGGYGVGGGGGSFFHQLGGSRGGPLAGGGSGASGPSNLRWGGAAFGGEGASDRPHFNPYFGGYNQNAPSKGVGVALRQKGDSDVDVTKGERGYAQGTLPIPGTEAKWWDTAREVLGPEFNDFIRWADTVRRHGGGDEPIRMMFERLAREKRRPGEITPNTVEDPEAPGYKKGKHTVQAVQGNTDTVPAMLTPREAVLNRNAAELAGRGNIEQLNAEGNELAEKGVDLAGQRPAVVGGKNMKAKKMQGGGYAPSGGVYSQKLPRARGGGMPGAYGPPVGGGAPTWTDVGFQGWQPHGGGDVGFQGWQPHGGGGYQPGGVGVGIEPSRPGPHVGDWQREHPHYGDRYRQMGMAVPPRGAGGGAMPGYLGPPVSMPPQPYGVAPGRKTNLGGGFYPQGTGMFQGGIEEVPPGPIGSPNPQQAYGPPVQLSAPDLSALLAKAGKEQGLNAGQIAGLTKAFQSFGSMGGGDATTDVSGGYYGLSQSPGGYQGGISDIGYPPFVAPNAEYHADKGSSWIGRYDPAYTLPIY